ncbi:magnesium chelatase subunit D family protein [Dyadobacter chenwenxiniae]|uniref:Mg-protoporphyrin IX chelatase n=1 Tax=Dyadobacter chenwenxiniae TaxID=2906456 RepID=A0A9X1PLJ1_9BACT|nr:magnesium chelatase subunit D family protein [Dyadobacter chenwenxiniae]MCF0063315.1 magnesium chelatase subunit D family protein [Dyadobacter chenwenxiniae]UON85306.1 magnesium chelatase subunit D family protein [Dyadobacter chenwenxiniae]
MSKHYPFSAIVGQPKLKKALLLCAVNPAIGGVLIKGEKGTAKSTAVRGLAAVMPYIHSEVSSGETHRLPKIPVPFVDLPLGASEDRVIGSLDIAAMVSEKKQKLLPGLLAAAHRGILYVDEVNLLPDHLVDILLDVAASGVNTIQREGLSIAHPSRFALIGTMNPEEGNLRPQFLDRFGLMVEVEAQRDIAERTEVVKRRISFEHNAEEFTAHWNGAQLALQTQIANAQSLLPEVVMPEGLLTLISQLCIERSVASLRADIVMYKTAITMAAMANRKTVIADDIRHAAELVLIHRKGKKPFEQKQNNPEADRNATPGDKQSPSHKGQSPLDNAQKEQPEPEDSQSGHDRNQDKCLEGDCPSDTAQVFLPAVSAKVPDIHSDKTIFSPEQNVARRQKTINMPKGFQISAEKFSDGSLAVSETIRHAIVRQASASDYNTLVIKNEDLHQKIKAGKTGQLILFVVDASGSMAAGKRMEAVKGSVLALLQDAYQKRDRVGVIAFRGVEAEVLLEPTRSIESAEQAMENLPTGGRTPLAHALQASLQLIKKEHVDAKTLLIVLSDGKANVPLAGGGDPWQQALQLAATIGEMQIKSLVLDTEGGYLRLGRAAELANALKGEYLSLDKLSAESITGTIHSHIYDRQQ